MLQKNRDESEILEREKTSKIKDWDFPRLHSYQKRGVFSQRHKLFYTTVMSYAYLFFAIER